MNTVFINKSKVFVLLFLSLNVLGRLTAQTLEIQGEKIDYIMPSGEGAALVKAVERQVSLATGVPEISIPIYTIPNTPISIRLSYNSSGLLANELPSIAGMGWRVESGGLITRVVIGIPDDYAANGYLKRTILNDLASKTISQYTTSDLETIVNLNSDTYDDSPDIFYYDIMGLKGKFILSKNGEVYCFPRNNLKITYALQSSTGKIDKFNVEFPNGAKADFACNESCTVTGYSPINTSFNSSWSIQALRSNNQVIATYLYKETNNSYTLSDFKAEQRQIIDESGNAQNNNLQYTINYSYAVLKGIETVDTRVSFNYTDGKVFNFLQTTSGFPYLSKIYVNFTEKDDVRSYGSPLYYSYVFGFDDLSGTTPYSRDKFLLKSFKVEAPNTSLPYSFDYFPCYLPDFGSSSVDLWGYYNGASNGNSIIPKMYNANGSLTVLPISTLTPLKDGASRASDLTTTECGVLKSITSPEGLLTEYGYELNSFLYNGYITNGAGLRIKYIKNYEIKTSSVSGQPNADIVLLNQENYTYLTEGTSPTTSGILLYHPMPVVGTKRYREQFVPANWANTNAYIKTSYCGVGSVPFFNPVYYTTVKTSKDKVGSSTYKFSLPVERTNTSILPASLDWAKTTPNSKLLRSTNSSGVFYNESNQSVPTFFHLWTTPMLQSVDVKNEAGVVVKNTTFTYGTLEVEKMASSLKLYGMFAYTTDTDPTIYSVAHLSKLYYLSAWRELLGSSETVFDLSGNNGTTHTRQFEYTRPVNGDNFSFVKQVKSVNIDGEAVITRYKYCFDPEFQLPADIESGMADVHDIIAECTESSMPSVPTRVGDAILSAGDCYANTESTINGFSISPEVEAINMLKQRGDYSSPIETTTILEKNNVKTVVGSEFSTLVEQSNHSILPVTSYRLSKPVPFDSFNDLGIVQKTNQLIWMLDFDVDYEYAGQITLYSDHGDVLERRGKDGVYTSYLYDTQWQSTAVEAVNCRYDNIKSYDLNNLDQTVIRSSNPKAMITTYKYFFPLGNYQVTDPRGRTQYTIYNALGEVIGVKDHKKNLRSVGIKKRKNQIGTAAVILDTEPDGDYTLNTESVSTNLTISIPNTNPIDMSSAVEFGTSFKPSYDYFVIYDNNGVEIPLTTSVFTHKFTTAGNHVITVNEKKDGQLMNTVSKTINLVRNSMEVYYNTLAGDYDGFNESFYKLDIKPVIESGTGEYTVTWNVAFTPSQSASGNVKPTYTQKFSGSGSEASFQATVVGDYVVTVQITDGVQTFQRSWDFTIVNSDNQSQGEL